MVRHYTFVGIPLLLAAIGAAASGCGDQRAMHPDASSLLHCSSNADCDDHIGCTVDNCDVSGMCGHTGIDTMCTAPQHCQVGVGCTSTMSCTDNTMCDDGIACTVDTCNVGNVCGHQAIDSICAAPTPVCDVTQGCVAGTSTGCTSSAQCDDSIMCTVDACGADHACSHTAVDSMCMTGERCTLGTGCVTMHSCATVADCTPAGQTWWNFCDGDAMCDTEFGCSFPTARACHDTDPCTIDSCDRSMGANGACVFACDTSRPECMCPTAGPTCAGHFQLSPAPSGRCIGANWDLSTITITNVDGALTISVPQLSTSGTLDTGASTATCPSFTATRVISGGCTETYTLMATFSDDDHLNGTFTTDFTGGPLNCGGCSHHSYSFTGTRIP